MTTPGWNLGVWHAFIQRWNVALSKFIVSTSESSTITPEEHCIGIACRNLSVDCSRIQSWKAALSIIVQSASCSTTITSEKHCVAITGKIHGKNTSRLDKDSHFQELELTGRQCTFGANSDLARFPNVMSSLIQVPSLQCDYPDITYCQFIIRPNCNGRISFSFNAVFNIFGFCLEIKWTCVIFIVFLSTGPTNDPHLLASPPWSHKRCVSIGHFTVPCHSYIPCALS